MSRAWLARKQAWSVLRQCPRIFLQGLISYDILEDRRCLNGDANRNTTAECTTLHFVVRGLFRGTVLYCTRATSSSCRTLQLLSLPLRFRLEKLLAGECKYRNDIPGIPFYCPFLPRTFRLFPYAFFHPALFFAFVFIIYLCTLPFFLLVQSVGSSCGDIKT